MQPLEGARPVEETAPPTGLIERRWVEINERSLDEEERSKKEGFGSSDTIVTGSF